MAKSPLADSILMPVPSSYNDIYEGRDFRDHVGDMVYEREVMVTPAMKSGRLVLRFASVNPQGPGILKRCSSRRTQRAAFFPLSLISPRQLPSDPNRLTVYGEQHCGQYDSSRRASGSPAVPRTLRKRSTIFPNFDFYNYSGIMRPVCLYTTPKTYIEDIVVQGKMDGSFSCEGDGGRSGCGECPDLCSDSLIQRGAAYLKAQDQREPDISVRCFSGIRSIPIFTSWRLPSRRRTAAQTAMRRASASGRFPSRTAGSA